MDNFNAARGPFGISKEAVRMNRASLNEAGEPVRFHAINVAFSVRFWLTEINALLLLFEREDTALTCDQFISNAAGTSCDRTAKSRRQFAGGGNLRTRKNRQPADGNLSAMMKPHLVVAICVVDAMFELQISFRDFSTMRSMSWWASLRGRRAA